MIIILLKKIECNHIQKKKTRNTKKLSIVSY